MFFFYDNTFVLRQGDPLGERLAKVAREQNTLLMICDQCALEPKDTVEGVRVGWPDDNAVSK
jgi:hypothetical protein